MTAESRQLPESGEIYLDHVGWMVPDMETAAAALTRLGFRLTPYSVQGDRDPASGEILPQGSANRLAMLGRGYLEFVTPIAGADTPVARHLRESMGRYVGVHLIALSAADAHAHAERLIAAGFRLQPPVNLRRSIEAADGSPSEVAFVVIRPLFGSIPEGRLQVLTHLTPDDLWQARYLEHPNAISALDSAVLVTADLEASSERLVRFTDREGAAVAGGRRFGLDRGHLSLLSPEAARRYRPSVAPATAAVGLLSHDLEATRAFLKRQEVGLLVDETERLVVDPREALGAALIIMPETEGEGRP
jgi:hypothetical protein